jgi:hypothetical protein
LSGMSKDGKAGGLSDARSVTASLQRSRNVLYKALHGSEMAVNQLSVDGELISDALNEHQYELKSSLKSTQSRLRTVQSYEFWERYSLTGLSSSLSQSLSFSTPAGSLIFFFAVVFYILAKRLRLFSLIFALIEAYTSVGTVPSFNELTAKVGLSLHDEV